MPKNSSKDRILNAARQLAHVLQNPANETPFEHAGDKNVIALKKLANVF